MGCNEKYCRNCNRMTKSNNTAPSDEAAKEIAKEVKEEIAEEPVKTEESVPENNNAKICSLCGAKLPDEAKVCSTPEYYQSKRQQNWDFVSGML